MSVAVASTVERHYTRRCDFTRCWRHYVRRGRRVLAYMSDATGWTLILDVAHASVKVTP